MTKREEKEFEHYNRLETEMYEHLQDGKTWRTTPELIDALDEEGRRIYQRAQAFWWDIIRNRWSDERTAVRMYHYWLATR